VILDDICDHFILVDLFNSSYRRPTTEMQLTVVIRDGMNVLRAITASGHMACNQFNN